MRMSLRMELKMICPMCFQSIGGGMDQDQILHRKLFGRTKYGACPSCNFPVDLTIKKPLDLQLWKAKVDGYNIAKNQKTPE